jgi:hypothetical protein
MPAQWPSCQVEPQGIAHVFTTLAVGAHCACGRAVAALSDDECDLVIRRLTPWPYPTARATVHARAKPHPFA